MFCIFVPLASPMKAKPFSNIKSQRNCAPVTIIYHPLKQSLKPKQDHDILKSVLNISLQHQMRENIS